MTADREYLTYAQALALLPSGNNIRTCTEPTPGVIVVATWTRAQIRQLLRKHRPELAGPLAARSGYGIAVVRESAIWIETKKQPC